MATPAPHTDEQILAALRTSCGEPALEFAERPRQLSGGYETTIYALRLSGGDERFADELVLRVHRDSSRLESARAEVAVYRTLNEAGFPAPALRHFSEDSSLLGGPFLLLEHALGAPLLRVLWGAPIWAVRGPGILARAHVRLHEVDPTPFIRDCPARAEPLSAMLDDLAVRVASVPGPSFLSGLQWLRVHCPEPGAGVLCHGDFHPLNIMVDGTELTAVIDWSNVIVADPEADVAVTRVAVCFGPIDLPGPVRPVVDWLRQRGANAYVREYRKHRPLQTEKLDYYEALRCFLALVGVASRQQDAADDNYPWGLPHVLPRLLARFRQLTGVRLSIDSP